jgi:hypothetical protein
MIVGRGGTTVVSDLPADHGLAGTARPPDTIKECGNPRAAPRSLRVTPSGQQSTFVLGGPSGVCGTDWVAVPGVSRASDRHPSHDLAVAQGSGETALDLAPAPSNWWPAHPTRAASVGAATGRREPLLGLPADPWRTRRAGLPACAQHGVVNFEASRPRSRTSP